MNMDNSVNRTLEKFSALRRPAVVSFFYVILFTSIMYELLMQIEFMSRWTSKYVPAILSYAEKHSKKNVFGLLADLDDASKIFLF